MDGYSRQVFWVFGRMMDISVHLWMLLIYFFFTTVITSTLRRYLGRLVYKTLVEKKAGLFQLCNMYRTYLWYKIYCCTVFHYINQDLTVNCLFYYLPTSNQQVSIICISVLRVILWLMDLQGKSMFSARAYTMIRRGGGFKTYAMLNQNV